MRYEKLRDYCLCDDYQKEYPDWPYTLYFHGHEFSRDIRFLDPILELGVINLGHDPIYEYTGIKYHNRLNLWFHYRFFFGNRIGGYTSGENAHLLPRLFRLATSLLMNYNLPNLLSFIEKDLCVKESQELILDCLKMIEDIIDILTKNSFVVWGDNFSSESIEIMNTIIRDKPAVIDFEAYRSLPHMLSITSSWNDAFVKERKEYRKELSIFNKKRKLDQKEKARNKSKKQ